MPKNRTIIHTDKGPDKVSLQSRTDRARIIAKLMPSSTLVQTYPDIKTAADDVVQAGTELGESDHDVQVAAQELETKIGRRAAKQVAYDVKYGVFCAKLEDRATTPEDITGAGMPVLARASYEKASPLGVQADFDPSKLLIKILVKMPPGMNVCRLEVSQTPNDEASWKEVRGHALRRKLTGYAPGTYWFRAATVFAEGVSSFCTPMMVVVK